MKTVNALQTRAAKCLLDLVLLFVSVLEIFGIVERAPFYRVSNLDRSAWRNRHKKA